MTDECVGMRRIQGGRFRMGSERFYPEEAPVRSVRLKAFWIDDAPVTNAAFARFVAATGHITTAEVSPDPRDYPGLDPAEAQSGSAVFVKAATPIDTTDPTRWWTFCSGADWRHPTGPDSGLDGLEDHPVVHVTAVDAEAYAAWAGKALPTEAEWELAARGGLEGADYAWGDELCPGGAVLANTWFGLFPFANQSPHGWTRTSPVRSFAPNGHGLYDMIGNVWEWTADDWSTHACSVAGDGCCDAGRSHVGTLRDCRASTASGRFPQRVLKGGSHLCAPNYCQRYRPAARHPQTIDTSTSHIGFRCVIRDR